MSWFHRKRVGHGDTDPKYYVYLLYIVQNGHEVPLYAGKGSGNRVTNHEKNLRNKLKKGYRLDSKERLMLLAEDLGYQIMWRIVESGLTEDEAFNLENETIMSLGLLQRGNVAYPHRLVKVQVA